MCLTSVRKPALPVVPDNNVGILDYKLITKFPLIEMDKDCDNLPVHAVHSEDFSI